MLSSRLPRSAILGRRVLPETVRCLGGVTSRNVVAAAAAANVRHFSAVVEDDLVFLRDPSLIKLKFKERLAKERQAAQIGGGATRIEKQHAHGSLTARERLQLLFDEGSFQELDQLKAHRCTEFGMDEKKFPGDGIVTGHGTINGRVVYAFSQGKK